jgi:tellurite methyltransferase
MNRSVDFFDTQFERQVRAGDFALNPFEQSALPFLRGRILDLGCGLGNLAIEAGRRGCSVVALDASVHAIERIRKVASAEALPVEAKVADLATYRITEDFDVIVSIGLLMFMESSYARQLLNEIQSHVRPDGLAIINVLIEGTTYLDMFEPGGYYLFGRNELRDQFAEWDLLESKYDSFDAPGSTVKRFATVIARKPPR